MKSFSLDTFRVGNTKGGQDIEPPPWMYPPPYSHTYTCIAISLIGQHQYRLSCRRYVALTTTGFFAPLTKGRPYISRYRQSSLPLTVRWTQKSFVTVASKSSLYLNGGCGARYRSSPTGGAAKGIDLKYEIS